MNTTQIMLHAVSITMFCVAALQHARGLYLVCRAGAITGVRWIIVWAAATGGFISLLCIALQVDSIRQEHSAAVGDAATWARIVFDYLLALYMLLIAEGIVVWTRWTNPTGHRRRWYDEDHTQARQE